MKNVDGMGLKACLSRQLWTNFRPCFFNYVIGSSGVFSETVFLEGRHSETIKATSFIHAVNQTQFVILWHHQITTWLDPRQWQNAPLHDRHFAGFSAYIYQVSAPWHDCSTWTNWGWVSILIDRHIYRWVYLVKATLIGFMAVKVEIILPMEITATWQVPMLHLWPNLLWNPSKHVEGKAKC